MHLVPREIDRLLISQTGFLAQRRLARGIKLNGTEATALITNVIQELIRDGNHSVAQLMDLGQQILGRRHVDPSAVVMVKGLQVEGTFRTGTHLVTIDQPLATDDGDLEMAMYGSCVATPSQDLFPEVKAEGFAPEKMPGCIIAAQGENITLSKGRKRTRLEVTNRGDRPIQVGSHYHFLETNPYLDFDRLKSYGFHLDIAAGTSARFEPGELKTVTLVEVGGLKTPHGGSSIAPGKVDPSMARTILDRLQAGGFHHTPEKIRMPEEEKVAPATMERADYAGMYGPTTGDLVRLSTTELWIKVERDLTVPGDECTFGGGKTLRDGIGQASGRPASACLALVVVGALVVDWSGIFKADVGVRDGRIVGIGKAGNPDVMDGVWPPGMVVGSNTDVVAAEGRILTAGGVDTHGHFVCPQQAEEALASGITTQFSGGTGPSTGTVAANCTPGVSHIRMMMQACDSLPLNYGIIGKGSDSGPQGLRDQVEAGVVGLKVHEDWGCTPATIDTCLTVCDEHDIQCELHSDSLNEAGFVEQTAAALRHRTVHAYHIEGAGGGHAPDLMRLVGRAHVLPSSTTPTNPYTPDTVDEHLDMAMSCHHLNKDVPEDVAFAESRVRRETIAAEDVLHDTGAISMMASDGQAMGRCGEVVARTWDVADANKRRFGALREDEGTGADNYRVKRYVSKYTINPAIAQGVGHVVGSVEVGKLADLVLWEPARFGTKPSLVMKSGFVAYAQMGDPNGSVSTVQPIIGRPMFSVRDDDPISSLPLVPSASAMFVSKASVANGAIKSYNLAKRIETVKDTRKVSKHDMKFNDSMPSLNIDPETFTRATISTSSLTRAVLFANPSPTTSRNQTTAPDLAAASGGTAFWYPNMDHTSAVRGYAPDLDGDYTYPVYQAVQPGDADGIQAAIDAAGTGDSAHRTWLASQPRVIYPPARHLHPARHPLPQDRHRPPRRRHQPARSPRRARLRPLPPLRAPPGLGRGRRDVLCGGAEERGGRKTATLVAPTFDGVGAVRGA
ncbi:Urease, alpha subunit [Cordyceps fumosorosea ARSEF 2679]|uniref:urease n=1 Tax=Cordyceps fumosorosea (strain ARSEF 2679) TaxID=1081104 RepID=A0A167J1M4_CORFA|nr:Urease, alpha subunit [Cordyceps fumosorosea ARSEF 2679]OAA49692.1 Urease, alpha subunit [Cordyceps fumosorosea ARSEF 2679]